MNIDTLKNYDPSSHIRRKKVCYNRRNADSMEVAKELLKSEYTDDWAKDFLSKSIDANRWTPNRANKLYELCGKNLKQRGLDKSEKRYDEEGFIISEDNFMEFPTYEELQDERPRGVSSLQDGIKLRGYPENNKHESEGINSFDFVETANPDLVKPSPSTGAPQINEVVPENRTGS